MEGMGSTTSIPVPPHVKEMLMEIKVGLMKELGRAVSWSELFEYMVRALRYLCATNEVEKCVAWVVRRSG